MQFTPAARALLQRLEGCRLTAYRCPAGRLTIGFGHTGADVHPDLVWSPSQADAALAQDLARFDAGVRQMLGPAQLTDNQFSALVIFAYNVGLPALHGSSALRDIRIGRLDQVPSDLAKWNEITDASGVRVVNAGLVRRRAAEGALWSTPDNQEDIA